MTEWSEDVPTEPGEYLYRPVCCPPLVPWRAVLHADGSVTYYPPQIIEPKPLARLTRTEWAKMPQEGAEQ